MQAVNPYQEDADYVTAANPLCKIPVLLTDEGAFFDSRVICEYLDVQGDKPKFLPDDFSARMAVKVREAAADGVLDAGVAIVMAGRVAPDMQNDAWKGWLMDKVKASLASFEKKTSPSAGDDWDMGDVALACALDFLSFRMPIWTGQAPIRFCRLGLIEWRCVILLFTPTLVVDIARPACRFQKARRVD